MILQRLIYDQHSVNGTRDYLVLKELSGKGAMEIYYYKVLVCVVVMSPEDRLWWVTDVQYKPWGNL